MMIMASVTSLISFNLSLLYWLSVSLRFIVFFPQNMKKHNRILDL